MSNTSNKILKHFSPTRIKIHTTMTMYNERFVEITKNQMQSMNKTYIRCMMKIIHLCKNDEANLGAYLPRGFFAKYKYDGKE